MRGPGVRVWLCSAPTRCQPCPGCGGSLPCSCPQNCPGGFCLAQPGHKHRHWATVGVQQHPWPPPHPAGTLRYPAPPSAPTLDCVQHPPLAPSQPSPLRPPQNPLPWTLLLQGIQKYPQVCILLGFGWFFPTPSSLCKGSSGLCSCPRRATRDLSWKGFGKGQLPIKNQCKKNNCTQRSACSSKIILACKGHWKVWELEGLLLICI